MAQLKSRRRARDGWVITSPVKLGLSFLTIREQHTIGKAHTQKIESKHINLRTRIKRLVRRTICFSKTERMHDLVIGLFINRYEFGTSV
jgi:IS1 family transposase